MSKTVPPTARNRYADAPRDTDWTIAQNWSSYSTEEHDRWNRLFARQTKLLPNRACDAFLKAQTHLQMSASGIPDFADLSRRLSTLTGWSVVAVAGLIPDDAFFEHLANRRFPAGAFIRPEPELDYLEEPDVFHDVFGHVPLLAVRPMRVSWRPTAKAGFARWSAASCTISRASIRYTVEFGLTRSSAACASSAPDHVVAGGDAILARELLAKPSAVRFGAHNAH